MGSSHLNLWHGRQRWGRGKHFMGSSPLYMAAVSLYRMAERPYVMAASASSWGYLKARLEGARQLDDREYRALLRRFERDSLLFGKTRTAQALPRAASGARSLAGRGPAHAVARRARALESVAG